MTFTSAIGSFFGKILSALVKALATLPVSDFYVERPSLEELFLTYYDAKEVT